jgi:Autographiviridae endonuclease VII
VKTSEWNHAPGEACRNKPVFSAMLGGQTFCCRRTYQRAHSASKPGEASARATAWNKANPERRRLIAQRHYRNTEDGKKDYYLQYTYGISLADYERLVMAQCGLCAVCGQPETKVQRNREFRLSVHHDHDSGRVVALLCAKCNRGMGLLGDDPELMRRAAAVQEGR